MSKMEFKINRCRVGSDNPTTIQVSKENFTNKIKDFFKMERMYPGTLKMLKIPLNTKHMNIMQKRCVRQFYKEKKMHITVIMTNQNILFVSGVVQR